MTEKNLRRILLCGLALLFLDSCSLLLPTEPMVDTATTPRSEACDANRLQLFETAPAPTAPSPGGDLHLISENPTKLTPKTTIVPSPIQPILGRRISRVAYNERRLIYPSAANPNREVITHLYLPPGHRKSPAVVVLPITSGDYFTEHFASYLADRGFVVLRFDGRSEFGEIVTSGKTGRAALQEFKNYFHFYAIDVLRGIDWLQSRPEVDPNKIGLLGISQGAVVGSLLAGIDARIRSGVFILGGGGLAGILSSAQEKSLIRLRRKVLRSGEISAVTYQQTANEVLSAVDPLTYANCIRPSTILLVDARFDRVILPLQADLLWEKMGKPSRIRIPSGHYTASLFLPYVQTMVLQHFQTTLEAPAVK